MARLIGPDKRVVVNQCTQWKRYSTPGQLRGESTILLDEFMGELADRHDEAPDGQGPGAPCEVLQQIRRVASCHNLAEQFPGYFVQRCDRPDLAAFRRRVHRILYLDHRVESLEELEKLIDADNEYLFGIKPIYSLIGLNNTS